MMRDIYDSKYRSVIKTISWRILATFTTMAIVYMFSKEIFISVGVGLVEVFTKMVFYYFHERVWNKFNWETYYHPLHKYNIKEDLDSNNHKIISKTLEELGYLENT